MGYLMIKTSLEKDPSGANLTQNWNKEFHTFPKSIYTKGNVIIQLEFEPVYYHVTVQYSSHNTTETSP